MTYYKQHCGISQFITSLSGMTCCICSYLAVYIRDRFLLIGCREDASGQAHAVKHLKSYRKTRTEMSLTGTNTMYNFLLHVCCKVLIICVVIISSVYSMSTLGKFYLLSKRHKAQGKEKLQNIKINIFQ